MNNEMKIRAIEKGKSIARVLIAGILYALWVLMTGLYIPCPIRTLTGFLCPGCGISHYFIHLIQFDFKQAFEAVKTFQGLEHRLQLIKTIDGVEFVIHGNTPRICRSSLLPEAPLPKGGCRGASHASAVTGG